MLYMLYIWVCNKVKWFLTELIMEPFHEDIWSSAFRAPRILFIGTRRGERSASRPGCFSLGQETPIYIWCEGGWGPTAGLHTLEYRKSLGLSGTEPRFLGRPTWLLMCMFGERVQLCIHMRDAGSLVCFWAP